MKEKENLMKKLALGMMPQPEMLAVETKKGKLFIGIPKEISLQEKRIPLTPGDVKVLINNGHEIIVESGAGKGANYDDRDYSEAGARIAYSSEEVYKAHIILKIEPPSIEEIEKMQYNQFLISALQIAIQPKDYLKRLMQKKITAVAFDFITDDEGIFPSSGPCPKLQAPRPYTLLLSCSAISTRVRGSCWGASPVFPLQK